MQHGQQHPCHRHIMTHNQLHVSGTGLEGFGCLSHILYCHFSSLLASWDALLLLQSHWPASYGQDIQDTGVNIPMGWCHAGFYCSPIPVAVSMEAVVQTCQDNKKTCQKNQNKSFDKMFCGVRPTTGVTLFSLQID